MLLEDLKGGFVNLRSNGNMSDLLAFSEGLRIAHVHLVSDLECTLILHIKQAINNMGQ